jgi:WD40 repeat protein
VSDDDRPGMVQKHLISMAKRHDTPAPSGQVTIVKAGSFHGAFPNSNWRAQAWSPDGSRLAYGGLTGSGKGILEVWDGKTGHHESHSMRHLTHGVTGEVLALSWAPDSRGLATLELNHQSGERAVGLRRQAKGSHLHAVPHGMVMSRVAWSPDGALLALSGPLCAQTVLFDPASGTVRRALENLEAPVAWQPHGRLLAGIYETSVLLCDPATGGRVSRLAGQDHKPTAIAWARNGKFLAVADGERIRVWDAEAGTQVSVIPWTTGEGDRGHDGKITSIEWLDDRYLLEFRPRGGSWRDEWGSTCSTAILWDAHEVKWHFIELFYEMIGGMRRPIAGSVLAPDGRRCAHAIDNHPPTIWRIDGDLPSYNGTV